MVERKHILESNHSLDTRWQIHSRQQATRAEQDMGIQFPYQRAQSKVFPQRSLVWIVKLQPGFHTLDIRRNALQVEVVWA
jgi:hypothetical protein